MWFAGSTETSLTQNVYTPSSVFILLFNKPVLLPMNMCKIAVWETNSVYLDQTAHITKTCLYNFDPLKPHFYIIKLGFTGVYIIFQISAQNRDCGYSLEPPRRCGSNEYPQSMFWAEIWKISDFFIWKFQFWVVKLSVYLNRHVFVMGLSVWIRNVSAVILSNWHHQKSFWTRPCLGGLVLTLPVYFRHHRFFRQFAWNANSLLQWKIRKLFQYEGPAKNSVTNRLPKFYPRYISKCFTALEWCVE